MNYFIDELKNKKVISKSNILILKTYIDKKYPEKTSLEKADILSKTIHHILDRNLNEFKKSERNKIKFTTLKKTLFNGKDSIFMYDLFHSCVDNTDLNENYKNELLNWINSKITTDIKKASLDTYLKNNIEISTSHKTHDYINSNNNFNNSKNTHVSIDPNVNSPKNPNSIFKILKKKKILMPLVLIFALTANFMFPNSITKDIIENITYASNSNSIYLYGIAEPYTVDELNNKFPNSHLPYYLRYRTIRQDRLKDFLSKNNSILVKEPYFSTIIGTAKKYNLNPILFFAITGQEQNFVPKNQKYARKIANNPFNVFHSWQEYNTNLSDSSEIAARTIINLSKNMPKNADPFLWIGKNYAEDSNWGYGVRSIFKKIENAYPTT